MRVRIKKDILVSYCPLSMEEYRKLPDFIEIDAEVVEDGLHDIALRTMGECWCGCHRPTEEKLPKLDLLFIPENGTVTVDRIAINELIKSENKRRGH